MLEKISEIYSSLGRALYIEGPYTHGKTQNTVNLTKLPGIEGDNCEVSNGGIHDEEILGNLEAS